MSAERPTFAEAVRRYADEVVDEFPHEDLAALAAEIEQEVGASDPGSDTDLAIAAELRRRAAAGVRKWPKQMN